MLQPTVYSRSSPGAGQFLPMVETDITSRLKEAIEAAGHSWSSAALAIGLSAQAPTKWKKGQVSQATVEKLANLTRYNYVWLLTGQGPKKQGGEESPAVELQPVSVWDDDTPVDDDEVEVPFYKEVEFSAGSGIVHGLEINGRRVRYGRSSLRAAGVDPHNAACGKATGNSMEPLIQDGSLVGIDRGKTQILDGEIYALDQDGMLRVKFVYRLPGGGLRLRSFNQDEHPDETYSAEDARSIKILGWVWTWSPPIRKWRGR